MKTIIIRGFLVGFILCQLYLLLYPHFGRYAYRHAERKEAIIAFQTTPTPETRATLAEEEARLASHRIVVAVG